MRDPRTTSARLICGGRSWSSGLASSLALERRSGARRAARQLLRAGVRPAQRAGAVKIIIDLTLTDTVENMNTRTHVRQRAYAHQCSAGAGTPAPIRYEQIHHTCKASASESSVNLLSPSCCVSGICGAILRLSREELAHLTHAELHAQREGCLLHKLCGAEPNVAPFCIPVRRPTEPRCVLSPQRWWQQGWRPVARRPTGRSVGPLSSTETWLRLSCWARHLQSAYADRGDQQWWRLRRAG